ncbi:hypothetical protein GGTG_12297 [Gaeumannomyces tritici R3-111a-1]|uniref:BTB domain-containing protein n=1 Tax=Gaeumannomyces tritici (strain R3-111a-1) TaxID=644352 RepID=J3PFM2_GAET3|nr:hypothetical protein GGTG_12297 [Gaeumannomyces tritici R3-111a-1]EJT70124.1 hypothetical protein GGTG_12297 [Gaeumannomyces tritici R3-111a-1]
MAEPAYSPLAQLLTDATFSDLTVTCAGGTTFRLHRVIVGAHSEYFSKACAGPFLEASSGQIDLPDVDPEDFKKLVDFVYTGTYTDYFTPVPHRSVSRKADASASISATVRGLRGKSLGRKPKLFPAVKGLRGKPLDRKPKAIAAVTGPPEEPPDREPKATEPKAFEPKAIKPPIIGRVPPEHLAESQEVEGTLFASARVYIIGDRFAVPALKAFSLMRFSAAVSHITLWLLGDGSQSRRPIIYHVRKLEETVDLIYLNTASTDVALKEPLCRLLLCLARSDPGMKARVFRLVRRNGELGVHLLAYADLVGGTLYTGLPTKGECPLWQDILNSPNRRILQTQEPRVDETRARCRHRRRGRREGGRESGKHVSYHRIPACSLNASDYALRRPPKTFSLR